MQQCEQVGYNRAVVSAKNLFELLWQVTLSLALALQAILEETSFLQQEVLYFDKNKTEKRVSFLAGRCPRLMRLEVFTGVSS